VGNQEDQYQHSSWLSMIFDRVKLAKPLMCSGATFAASIDIKEIDKLTAIFDDLFGENSKKNSITIKRGSATGAKVINPGVVNTSENVLLYSSNDKLWEPNRVFRRKEYDNRYGSLIVNFEEGYEKWVFKSVLDGFSELLNVQKSKLKKTLEDSYEEELEKFVIANSARVVRMASLDDNSISIQAKEIKASSIQEPGKIFHIKRDNANDYYILNGGVLLFYKDRLIKIGDQWVPGEPITDIWDDVLPNDLHNEGGVTLRKGKKPEKLINRILDIGSCENELVLDFFIGSGTTAAVAQKTNRKWIGVEQGEYFDTTTKIRLLKTLNGESSGISSTVGWLGGGVFKYIKLESYEDTLNNLQLRRTAQQQDLLDTLPQSAQQDYLLRYLLDIESRGSLLSVEQFNQPFDCKLKVTVDSAGAYEERTIDLVETFNYLIGLRVKHIDMQMDKGFVSVTGWLPTGEKTLVLWRDVAQVDYETLSRLCDKLAINPADSEFEIVYINGDHNIPAVFTSLESEGGVTKNLKIRQIEPEFLSRMFSVEGM
jgi:adenine-specific DNA-methyltransferase